MKKAFTPLFVVFISLLSCQKNNLSAEQQGLNNARTIPGSYAGINILLAYTSGQQSKVDTYSVSKSTTDSNSFVLNYITNKIAFADRYFTYNDSSIYITVGYAGEDTWWDTLKYNSRTDSLYFAEQYYHRDGLGNPNPAPPTTTVFKGKRIK
jgi:hypothetical protein